MPRGDFDWYARRRYGHDIVDQGNREIFGTPDPFGNGPPVAPPWSGAVPYTPGQPWALARAAELNRLAQRPEHITATVNAALAPIAVRYGRVTVGARIFARCVWQEKFVLGCAWGRGPIDAIESVLVDDAVPHESIAITNYTGSQVAADPTLVAAFAAQAPSKLYADILPGRAYSVVVVPPGVTKGFPRITAVLRGLKLYEPRKRGLVFDGTGDFVTIPAVAAHNLVDAFTIEGWLTHDAARTNGAIFEKTANGQTNSQFLLYVEGDNFRFRVVRGVMTTIGFSFTGFTGKPTHVAGTYDGRFLRLYVDFVERAVHDFGSNGAISGGVAASYIGKLATAGATYDEQGTIREVKLWNYARSVAQMKEAAHRVDPRSAGLVGYWKLDELSGTVATDYTGNSNGAITNAVWSAGPDAAGLKAWSANPALCLGDFLHSPVYGAGRVVDWDSVAEAADFADELVGPTGSQEKRRLISLSIERPAPIDSWIEALRTYAACGVTDLGGRKTLIPDRPRAAAGFVIDASNSSLLSLRKRGRMHVPTVMTIAFTDTAKQPAREERVQIFAAGVEAGTTPYRESTVRLEGITRYSQARREGIERLNKLTLRDLNSEHRLNDQGVQLVHGDVVPVTHVVGLTAKLMSVESMVLDSAGRWIARMLEYDPAVYSDEVVSAPTFTDTTMPDPNVPPTPGAVALFEEIFQFQSFGQYGSRFRITVTPPAAWPYIAAYDLELLDGTDVVYANRLPPVSGSLVDRTGPLKEGVTYTAKVYVVSSTGIRSAVPASTSLLCQGKFLPPGDVPAILTAFERGGDLIMRWTRVVDIDTVRYEIRRGPVAGFNWDTASFVTRVDAEHASVSGEPIGTWRYGIKALDSVGQYSVNAVVVDVTITQDPDAFLQAREFSAPTLTNMIAFPPVEGAWKDRWITSVAGQTFNAAIAGTVNAVVTPVIVQHQAGTSRFVGEAWDLGFSVTGDFSLGLDATPVSGVFSQAIETSPDGVTWTQQLGALAHATARVLRPVVEALAAATLKINDRPKLTLTVIAKQESGVATTLVAGGKLVQLQGRYAAHKDLQVSVMSAVNRGATWDRLLLHPEVGLQVEWNVNNSTLGGTSAFYWRGYNCGSARVVVAGDILEWDVYIDPSTPTPTASGESDGGILVFDGAWRTDLTFTDVEGYETNRSKSGTTPFDPLARGKWKTRQLDLAAILLGSNITAFAIAGQGDGTGAHKVLYRNIRVTNGGVTVATFATGTTEPSGGSDVFVSGDTAAQKPVVNQRSGPSNSFLVYAWNPATAAQTANDVRWAIEAF